MKKVYLFCLLLASLFCYAQTPPAFTCGSEPELPTGFSMFTTPVVPDPSEVFVINVFIHVITDDNGNINENMGSGNVLNFYDEEEMMEVMYVLNKNYGPHNIFFKYRGYDIIADSDLTNDVTSNWSDYNVPGNFNLYFVNDLGGNSASAMPNNTRSMFTYYALAAQFEKTIVHEIGHNMSLLHTFQIDPLGPHPCEHVTRDVNDPDYNADVAGDFVTDTAASPVGGPYVNCVYQTSANWTDCQGTPYQNVELNFMGYSVPVGCQHVFTPGQILRVRTYLNNITAPHLLACFTTVEELYEPYYVGHIQGDIVGIYQEPDGYVKVCCEAILEYRYQKGLTYEFDGHSSIPPTQAPEDWPILHPEMGEFDTYVLEFGTKHFEIEVPPSNPIEICSLETFVSGIYYSTECIGCPINENEGTELKQSQLEDVDFYSSFDTGYYFITRITSTGKVYTVTVYVP